MSDPLPSPGFYLNIVDGSTKSSTLNKSVHHFSGKSQQTLQIKFSSKIYKIVLNILKK